MKKLHAGLSVATAHVAASTLVAAHAAGPAVGGDAAAAARHVLDRITFGARPGDVERVVSLGIDRFVDEQLHPGLIDGEATSARLDHYPTLTLSSREIAERYALPAMQARREAMRAAGRPSGDNDRPPAIAADVRAQAALPLVELASQKILRATYSERQLQEVLTDFWFNHFNVDARKGPVRYMLTEYEREAIRPHVLGHFRDLLGATAKSPAMLFYLDNWMSTAPDAARRERRRPAQAQRGSGLNENYGRELLELHTLGVDGGYTQNDVTAVARAFTGWTIDRPRLGGGFRFAPALHDAGEKVVLGHRITGGGQRDGEQVLDLLASHPSTARFISTALARRFVSDSPPPALVARMADTFLRTSGDLRAVMTTLLTSPEFLSPEARHAKVKTPFEFVISSLRATGAEIADPRPLVRTLQQLGMPLYQCQPPTGYKDDADSWINTGALVNRMNVALAMAAGRLPGVTVDTAVARSAILPAGTSAATMNTIARAQNGPQALALTLGAPEFQRR